MERYGFSKRRIPQFDSKPILNTDVRADPAENRVRTRICRSSTLAPLQPATGSWFQSNVASVTIPPPTNLSASSGLPPSASQALAPALRAPLATSTPDSCASAATELRVAVPSIVIGIRVEETPARALRHEAPVPRTRALPFCT